MRVTDDRQWRDGVPLISRGGYLVTLLGHPPSPARPASPSAASAPYSEATKGPVTVRRSGGLANVRRIGSICYFDRQNRDALLPSWRISFVATRYCLNPASH